MAQAEAGECLSSQLDGTVCHGVGVSEAIGSFVLRFQLSQENVGLLSYSQQFGQISWADLQSSYGEEN